MDVVDSPYLFRAFLGRSAAFLAALLFFLGFNHLREQFVAASKVSQNPQIVYWAHIPANCPGELRAME